MSTEKKETVFNVDGLKLGELFVILQKIMETQPYAALGRLTEFNRLEIFQSVEIDRARLLMRVGFKR
jgi:hypothetical protein